MDRKKTGEKLREYRGNKTIQEVANALGISISAVRMYEAGERMPRDEVKLILARYYGTSVAELFFADPPHSG